MQGAVGEKTLFVGAEPVLGGEGGEPGEPFAGEAAQTLVRGACGGVLGRGVLRGFPGFDEALDVPLEDLGQIMVAVELVLVGDAGEGLDGGHWGRKERGFSAWRRPGPG